METILFWVFAVVAVVSAALMVGLKNPLMGALSLAISFLATAGLFSLLSGPFVGIMQVLVYAGAIIVLVLFVIMLLGADEPTIRKERIGVVRLALGGLLGLPFAGIVVFAILDWGKQPRAEVSAASLPEGFGGIEAFGNLLFREYVYPFEIVSILLLVAIIGVVVLAKREF